MRCPKCHRKVHPDDIYCVHCSTSLRGRSPEDPWNCVCADEKIHNTHHPRRNTGKNQRKPMLIIIVVALALTFLPTLLAGIFFTVETVVEELQGITAPAPEPEPIAPEDAWKLGIVLADWEGFTVTAEYISMDEDTGEIELIYTAENQTGHTIITSDAAITVEGYRLPRTLYIELEPGETTKDYLWLDTEVLQAVDITQIQELTISMDLMDGEDYVLLSVTDPVPIPLDFYLPKVSMRRGDTTLIESEELTVTLVGHKPNPEYGSLTLYTLVENRSLMPASLFMEEARCGDADLHLYGYYDVAPGEKLLCWDQLYDIPYSESEPTEISFHLRTQDATFETTATGRAHIRLDPDGHSGQVRGEWE